MAEAGVIAPSDPIVIDGELHRYKTDGKDKSGWYIFFPDNIVAGSFGDWKSAVELNFCANVGREITASELEDQKRRIALAREARATEKARQHKEVAESVGEIWNKAQPASEKHPYLDRKGIPSHGTKVASDGRLMLPMYNAQGIIMSLEYITGAGKKSRHPNGQVKGNFWCIGVPENTGTIYITEGFANAAVIHEAMNAACFISYGAFNLPATADFIRSEMPSASIVIVADNDEAGTGKKFADQAVMKSGVSMVLMPEVGKDAWDYHQSGHDLNALLDPPEVEKKNEWLQSFDDFMTDLKPIRWFVKGILPKSSSIMLFGPSGTGKSFLSIDLMMHIATGRDEWNGRKVRSGRVAYLAGEGHHGVKMRMALWMQENGRPGDKPRISVSKSALDLDTEQGINFVLKELSMLPEPPDLIVIDTLNRFMSGDENSSQDGRSLMNKCDRIRLAYPDSSNVFVHHTGVSGDAQKRGRGSSSILGTLETQICLTPKDDAVEMEMIKTKDTSKSKDKLYFMLKEVGINGLFDEDGDQSTSAIVTPVEAPPEKEEVPKLSRADKKKHGYLVEIEAAWNASGRELHDGKPYVGEMMLREFFAKEYEKKNDKAMTSQNLTNKMSESDPKRLLGFLLIEGEMRRTLHGYVVCKDEIISKFMLGGPL